MHDVGLDEDADDDKPPNNTDADEADEWQRTGPLPFGFQSIFRIDEKMARARSARSQRDRRLARPRLVFLKARDVYFQEH